MQWMSHLGIVCIKENQITATDMIKVGYCKFLQERQLSQIALKNSKHAQNASAHRSQKCNVHHEHTYANEQRRL